MYLSTNLATTTLAKTTPTTQPYYFLTLCTYQQHCLLGRVQGGVMQLNALGRLVQQAWRQQCRHTQALELDSWVVMPNHLHAILKLPVDTARPAFLIKQLVQQFQQAVQQQVHGFWAVQQAWSPQVQALYQVAQLQAQPSLWQRGFSHYLLADQHAYLAKRQALQNNPQHWEKDYLYCAE